MTTTMHTLATAGVTVAEGAPRSRHALRLRDAAAAGAALGLALPVKVGALAEAAGRRALCLGPDEWLLEGPPGDRPLLPETLPHALVDISDREVTFVVEGPRAAELLSIGIARNLALLAPGTGCRTAFDSAQAILVRESEQAFTLSVWRSFAPHVAELLDIGQRELACGL
jgi:sarcosine oxidase subunit gamma